METTTSIWLVLFAASMTAVSTGFGAIPFFFVKEISDRWLGIGNSIAAGLMLGASIGLIWEGVGEGAFRLVLGMAVGLVLIVLAKKFLEGREDSLSIGQLEQADAMKMLLIVGIMTVHSFAEGIGVGVSWGGGQALGSLINIAIAVHNIPEGLAISLVLIPRGSSVWRAMGWSVFSSIPQPLMAVPAFLFVLVFEPFLSFGFGLAAGAMIWMVFTELMPEAVEDIPRPAAYTSMIVAVAAMMLFQALIG